MLTSLTFRAKRPRKALREELDVLRYRLGRRPDGDRREVDVLVSLTSFPRRISDVWITIESILRQSVRPKQIFLVLAEEEFPGRAIPKKIMDQTRRGLEILWEQRNLRAHKKFIPVMRRFPDETVVAFDDDRIYGPRSLESLVLAHEAQPLSVIGNRARAVQAGPDGALPYATWPRATPSTPEHRLMLIGVGGVLIPPGSIDRDLFLDVDVLQRISPTSEDVWNWAVERHSRAQLTWTQEHRSRALLRMGATPSLVSEHAQAGTKDAAIRRAVEYFDLLPLLFADDPDDWRRETTDRLRRKR